LSHGSEGLKSSKFGGVCTLGRLAVSRLGLGRIVITLLILLIVVALTPISLVLVVSLTIPAISIFLSSWSLSLRLAIMNSFRVIIINRRRLLRSRIRLVLALSFLFPVSFGGVGHGLLIRIGAILLLSFGSELHSVADFKGVSVVGVLGHADFGLSSGSQSDFSNICIGRKRIVVDTFGLVHLTHIGPALVSWRLVVTWHSFLSRFFRFRGIVAVFFGSVDERLLILNERNFRIGVIHAVGGDLSEAG